MKKVTFIALSILAAAIFLFWVFKFHQYKPLTDTVVIGTSADFPPLSFIDKDNVIRGFDIEVAKEIAKRLNLKSQVINLPFNQLLPEIKAGNIHIIAAGISPTPARQKKAYFTKPYLTGNPFLAITQKVNPQISSINDLENKKVVVNEGHLSDLYLSSFPNIEIIRVEKPEQAFEMLEQHKAYAYVTSAISLAPVIKELGVGIEKFNSSTLSETNENISIAIAKNLPEEFRNSVQQALDNMENDGTLNNLKIKWNLI